MIIRKKMQKQKEGQQELIKIKRRRRIMIRKEGEDKEEI